MIAASAALAAAGFAAPAQAVDFLGISLWESYPGQSSHALPGYDYPPPRYFHDLYTGRYCRRS